MFKGLHKNKHFGENLGENCLVVKELLNFIHFYLTERKPPFGICNEVLKRSSKSVSGILPTILVKQSPNHKMKISSEMCTHITVC